MGSSDFSQYPAATLIGSHARTLASAKVGVDYLLSIWLPESYATGEQSYPVIYLLDSINFFGVAVGTTQTLTNDDEVPECILVGIGNHMASAAERGLHRGRDYDSIPNQDQPADPGGAPQFLEFLVAELIPFIEANYRGDPADRILFGYSLGGHFVMYALMKRPALFHRYIAGAPAMSGFFRARFDSAMAARRLERSRPAHLAILVGELDDLRLGVEAFWTGLQDRNEAGLDLKTIVLPGETHASGGASAYTTGLRAVFHPPSA